MATYTFTRTDDSDTIWPTIEIKAESYSQALAELQGCDGDPELNVVRDWHGVDGGGDIGDVLRDGQPLRDHWSLANGEVF